jgi:oxygen-independent coproporphyrinogen-3 oxidase
LQDKKVSFEEEVLTPEQKLNEYIMTSLRTMWGTDLQKIETIWGADSVKKLLQDAEKFIEVDQLIQDKNLLILTNKGKLFADAIAGHLFL